MSLQCIDLLFLSLYCKMHYLNQWHSLTKKKPTNQSILILPDQPFINSTKYPIPDNHLPSLLLHTNQTFLSFYYTPTPSHPKKEKTKRNLAILKQPHTHQKRKPLTDNPTSELYNGLFKLWTFS